MENTEILYQGHGSLRIKSKDGKVIYIDPYVGEGYDEPADLILVTHQHPDHNKLDRPAKKEDCIVLQNYDFLINDNYLSKDIGDIHIEAVEAYNHTHPKGMGVGYILTIDGLKIYIAGDTGITEKMKEIGQMDIDYAFLPIDGFFTMNPEEAEESAKLINAKYIIPYHVSPGSLYEEQQAEKLKLANKIMLRPGEALFI